MTQEAHTPEPWRIDSKLQIRAPDIFDDGAIAEDWVVAAVDTGCGYPDCQDKANARRIVACVNALAGIPIEAIESGVVAELATKAAALLDATERHVFGDECAKERAEMRAALAKLEASK